ncbi:MAG: TraY domain-containing protein [Mariprofundaceae bacterium]|nr:TraY domain-containing protein [Mariprofundaceae bacterium]
MTISVRLPSDMEQRLTTLANKTGRKKSFYIKEALIHYLEDLEDIYHAEKALSDIKAGRSNVISMEEMEASLGLGD